MANEEDFYDELDPDEKATREEKYKKDYIKQVEFECFDLKASSPDVGAEVERRLASGQGRRYTKNEGAADAHRNALELEREVRATDEHIRSEGGGAMGSLMDWIDKDGPDRDIEGNPIGRKSARLLKESARSDRTLSMWQRQDY